MAFDNFFSKIIIQISKLPINLTHRIFVLCVSINYLCVPNFDTYVGSVGTHGLSTRGYS